jgi:hypothetical protein
MVARAVTARDWLTPLAVLVPILATAAAALVALASWPPLVPVAVLLGLAVTARAGRRTYGVRISLLTALLTLVADVVALFIAFAVSINNASVCGKTIADGWLWLPWTGGVLVYFAVGTYGLRTGRALFLVPLALLFGVLTVLTLIALVPGTHEFCD